MPMNLPNKLTIVRIIMIPFFVFFLLTDFVAGSKLDRYSTVLCS